MRFFVTGNVKNNKPLYLTVGFFLFFCALYWTGNIVYFRIKYGFTYADAYLYFFTDMQFPEKISLGHLSEDTHVYTFLTGVFLLVLSPLFLFTRHSYSLKIFFIVSSFIAALLDMVSGYLIYFFSEKFIYLKLFSFAGFQLVTGLMLILVVVFLVKKDRNEPSSPDVLNLLVFLFSLFTMGFVAVNFILFFSKVGFTPQDVSLYYLGSPEKFTHPKTFEGLFETAHPHFLAMGLYLMALTHFVFFTDFQWKVPLVVFTFLFALLDNYGGLFVRFGGAFFSPVKWVSFMGFHACLLVAACVLIADLMKSGVLKCFPKQS